MLGNKWHNKRYFNRKKIYQELSLESLKFRRWFRELFHFYKIFKEKSLSYLFDLIPNFNRAHNTRLSYNIPPIKVRHDYFKNSFFSSAISVWKKLDFNNLSQSETQLTQTLLYGNQNCRSSINRLIIHSTIEYLI